MKDVHIGSAKLLTWLNHLLVFTSIFFLFLYPVLDADLGWHLRYGDYFWQHGQILKANTFSFQMPNFIWANHSWGFDIISSLLFKLGSFQLLSIIGSLLIAGSLYLCYLTLAKKELAALMVLIFWAFNAPLLNLGYKSKLVSLFFTCLLWFFLKNYQANFKKIYLYLIPPLFLLWTNIHGEFAIGFLILAVFLLPLLYQDKIKKKQSKLIIATIALSGAVTFLNPYFYQLHLTAIAHLSSPSFSQIYEWQPLPLSTPLMIAFLSYSFLFWLTAKKSQKTYIGEFLVLAIINLMALKARRFIPLFLLLSLPHFINCLSLSISKAYVKLINIGLLLTITIYALLFHLPKQNILAQNWASYCNTEVLCSEGLISFLQENKIKGKIFNAYRLGGYLEYRYPQVPMYIDGRMTVWRDQNGQEPFSDYAKMVYTQPGWRELFMAQDFDFAILNKPYPLTKMLVEQEYWLIMYEDEKLVVLKNPKT
ncbi:hypothetical protein GYA49_00160 [Candidatus Beckwithbacteria bacterium]|nr:hypothetical protein [Candidatus Beckwithbacteria bacterium]